LAALAQPFWMILAGVLGMATKFAECTLGVKYREVHEDGSVTAAHSGTCLLRLRASVSCRPRC
jgi:hypothetical protein